MLRSADPHAPVLQEQRFAMRHPAAGGELADLPRIEQGWAAKSSRRDRGIAGKWAILLAILMAGSRD